MARFRMRALVALLMLAAVSCSGPPAHLVLRGGTVWASADDGPYEAIAVRDGYVLALGSDADSEGWIGPNTEVVELEGRAAYPGFADGHAHLMGIGALERELDLIGTTSYAEVVAHAVEAAADLADGQWLVGRGWDQNDWAESAFPHHGPLSDALPDLPVVLTRIDGHALLANEAAMRAAGITPATPDPSGGRILRGADGKPTGVFIDAAESLVLQAMPAATQTERVDTARRGIAALHRSGITSVHDAGASRADIGAYEYLVREERFPMRAHVMVAGNDAEAMEWWLQQGPQYDYWGAGRLTVRAVKVYADGALGSRGAALLADYSDEPGNRGLVLAAEAQLRALAEACRAAGFQVCTHAIGDRANRQVLDAYETVLGADAERDHRWRVEHAQVLHPDDVPRFAALGVIPAMQAQHQASDMPWAEERLGPQRVTGAYAWRSLLDSGAVIAGGSDAPVERLDVVALYIASVWRVTRDGEPLGGWYAEEAMTREEALRSLTEWPAFAAFRERQEGTLRRGRRADITVIDRDLMTASREELADAQVWMTVFDGAVVYGPAE
jgi:predicted amidohydrolase YtcJ